MSANLQPGNRQGIKRDAQGQPKDQSQPEGEASPELRRFLQQMPTSELISIFDLPLREHIRHLNPTINVDKVIEDLKRNVNRDKLLQLAALLPHVISELRDPNHQHTSRQNEHSSVQPQDSQMEIVPNTSPPPPYEGYSRPSDIAPSSSVDLMDIIIPRDEVRPPRPLQELTVLSGLYTPGKGKNKTSEITFDVSEEDYVRTVAWSHRFYKFDRSNEHVAYQYKVVLSSEIEQLTASLASFDVVEPINPVSSDDSASVEQQQAIQYEQVQYERAVAQSIYMLPTVWPPNADYLVDLNHDKSRQLCPSTESDPYLDITDIIRQGSNTFTLIEFKDARKYTFCLFKKAPSTEEIETAATF